MSRKNRSSGGPRRSPPWIGRSDSQPRVHTTFYRAEGRLFIILNRTKGLFPAPRNCNRHALGVRPGQIVKIMFLALPGAAWHSPLYTGAPALSRVHLSNPGIYNPR